MREAAFQPHHMLRLLCCGRIGFVFRRAHQEGPMRDHHELRPAAAVLEAIGENLAWPEHPVMGGQVDAFAQFPSGRIGGGRNPQHFGQPLACGAQSVAIAKGNQPFVAQAAHPLLADDADAPPGCGDDVCSVAHPFRMA